MRDAEARERLDQLEATLSELPELIKAAVISATRPTLERMTSLGDALETALAELRHSTSKAEGVGELLQVVEEELSTLRGELAVVHAQTNSNASAVEAIMNTFARVGRAV